MEKKLLLIYNLNNDFGVTRKKYNISLAKEKKGQIFRFINNLNLYFFCHFHGYQPAKNLHLYKEG